MKGGAENKEAYRGRGRKKGNKNGRGRCERNVDNGRRGREGDQGRWTRNTNKK